MVATFGDKPLARNKLAYTNTVHHHPAMINLSALITY
jgi:hypothetical protein